MAATVSEAEFDRARAQVYDLLAAVFDGDMVVFERALADRAFDELASALPGEIDAPTLGDPEERDLDRSALELGFDNLFEVPGPHYVPPFASAHADEPSASFESASSHHEAGEAGELYGEPAARMAELFDRVGYRPERGEGIPDHVASQLAFVAALARIELQIRHGAAESPLTVEEVRSVTEDALAELGWLGQFADAVEKQDASVGVFADLVAFADAFVTWDAAEHGVVLD